MGKILQKLGLWRHILYYLNMSWVVVTGLLCLWLQLGGGGRWNLNLRQNSVNRDMPTHCYSILMKGPVPRRKASQAILRSVNLRIPVAVKCSSCLQIIQNNSTKPRNYSFRSRKTDTRLLISIVTNFPVNEGISCMIWGCHGCSWVEAPCNRVYLTAQPRRQQSPGI